MEAIPTWGPVSPASPARLPPPPPHDRAIRDCYSLIYKAPDDTRCAAGRYTLHRCPSSVRQEYRLAPTTSSDLTGRLYRVTTRCYLYNHRLLCNAGTFFAGKIAARITPTLPRHCRQCEERCSAGGGGWYCTRSRDTYNIYLQRYVSRVGPQ